MFHFLGATLYAHVGDRQRRLCWRTRSRSGGQIADTGAACYTGGTEMSAGQVGGLQQQQQRPRPCVGLEATGDRCRPTLLLYLHCLLSDSITGYVQTPAVLVLVVVYMYLRCVLPRNDARYLQTSDLLKNCTKSNRRTRFRVSTRLFTNSTVNLSCVRISYSTAAVVGKRVRIRAYEGHPKSFPPQQYFPQSIHQ